MSPDGCVSEAKGRGLWTLGRGLEVGPDALPGNKVCVGGRGVVLRPLRAPHRGVWALGSCDISPPSASSLLSPLQTRQTHIPSLSRHGVTHSVTESCEKLSPEGPRTKTAYINNVRYFQSASLRKEGVF